jgi:carbamoyl-phosphate synthase large subunit
MTGLPAVIRPSFTLGGTGAGIVYNMEEFEDLVTRGLDLSPVHEILIEESVLGWKEYELEVMRDKADNFVVICTIENFDPMGIHTGDSVTVAPCPDPDRSRVPGHAQRGRAPSSARSGSRPGGSNIQFAVDPKTGRMVVIEMNPRVSRSSAPGRKATGFPIAKIAPARHRVPPRRDQERHHEGDAGLVRARADYVVVKIPRWAFEKFRGRLAEALARR